MSFSKKFKDKSPIKRQGGEEEGILSKALYPIKKNIAENLTPSGYSDPYSRIAKSAIGIPDGVENKFDQESSKERRDLLAIMMNQPQKYNTIQKSKYKPSVSKDSDIEYYDSKATQNLISSNYDKYSKLIDIKKSKNKPAIAWDLDISQAEKGKSHGVLGNFTIDKGVDKDGREYISYYDIWDLQPFGKTSSTMNKISDYIQDAIGVKSPEIYGRIYKDEVGKETWQEKMENKNKL